MLRREKAYLLEIPEQGGTWWENGKERVDHDRQDSGYCICNDLRSGVCKRHSEEGGGEGGVLHAADFQSV